MQFVNYIKYYVLLGCTSIRNIGENTIIGENSKSITLKWNVYGVKDGSIFRLHYNNKVDDNAIGSNPINGLTGIKPLVEDNKVNNPFKGRWSRNIIITNGNRTCEATFSNLQYDDAGVIILYNQFGRDITQENVTLIVHGKF